MSLSIYSGPCPKCGKPLIDPNSANASGFALVEGGTYHVECAPPSTDPRDWEIADLKARLEAAESSRLSRGGSAEGADMSNLTREQIEAWLPKLLALNGVAGAFGGGSDTARLKYEAIRSELTSICDLAIRALKSHPSASDARDRVVKAARDVRKHCSLTTKTWIAATRTGPVTEIDLSRYVQELDDALVALDALTGGPQDD